MTTQDITNITAAAAKLNGTTNTVTPDMAAEYARLLAENAALKAAKTAESPAQEYARLLAENNALKSTVTAPVTAKKTRIVEVPADAKPFVASTPLDELLLAAIAACKSPDPKYTGTLGVKMYPYLRACGLPTFRIDQAIDSAISRGIINRTCKSHVMLYFAGPGKGNSAGVPAPSAAALALAKAALATL